jgi:hypothetical protein
MSLSKGKCWYSNNCLHCQKHAAPFGASLTIVIDDTNKALAKGQAKAMTHL